MTELLQAVRGKRAERERHMLCRAVLVELIAHDPGFFAVADKAFRVTGLDKLHTAAKAELAAGGSADGDAVTRYMAKWENDKIVKWTLAHYVSDDLRLPWPWLAADLYQLLYFMMKNLLPRVKQEIPLDYWLLMGRNRDGERYQQANETYVRDHVEWFYRHRVKNPPDSIRAIADSLGKHKTETVRSALKRVEKTLARVVPLKEVAR